MLGDERIEGGAGHLDRGVPNLVLPTTGPIGGGHEIRRGSRDGGIGRVDLENDGAHAPPAGRLEQRHALVAAMDRPYCTRAQRLRLQRYHARSKTPEAPRPVADVGADVEGEVAGAQEARV